MHPPAQPPEYDLCGKIIGCAMRVHRTLGPGFLESVYPKALMNELRSAGHAVRGETPIQVRYRDEVVGDFFADLLLDGAVIVELKAIERLAVIHEVQLVNYLAATGLDEGLLLNFGASRLEYKKKFRRPSAVAKQDSVNSVEISR